MIERLTVFTLFVALFGVSMLLWAQEVPPQEEPPTGHQEPVHYCTPHARTAPDGTEIKGCDCLHNEPNGCVNGKRDIEMRNCNSWCFKDRCFCCQS